MKDTLKDLLAYAIVAAFATAVIFVACAIGQASLWVVGIALAVLAVMWAIYHLTGL